MTAAIQPSTGPAHTRIHGIGAYRPRRVVTNEEICRNIDSSDEWIRSRSGIETRHFAEPDETVAMKSVAAAGKALAQAGIDPAQVDMVLIATVTHLKQIPAVATEVAHQLG